MKQPKKTIHMSDIGNYDPQIGLDAQPIREGKKLSKKEIEELHKKLEEANLS